jgi:8-hydroxy-5-deazaflavin:NADPH oxidoreductase
MSEKMTIAILGGTGKEGGGLALRWAHEGFPIIIGSRGEEKAITAAKAINETLGITTVRGMENGQAAREADISVLTVVEKAQVAALNGLKEDLKGKILVDTTVRLNFKTLIPPVAPSASEIAQEILGEDTIVVSAYQNVPAPTLRKNLGEKLALDVLVTSNSIEAAETVIQLSNAIGIEGYYAGPLSASIVVEGITPLLIHMNKHYKGHGGIQISGINK